MWIAPSRRLAKAADMIQEQVGEVQGIEERQAYVSEMTACINGNFGMSLFKALESLEVNGYDTLYKSSMKTRQMQAKAEIKTAKYLKAMLMGYIIEESSLAELMKQHNNMENGEYNED
jgi:hypothetical protein